MTQISFKPVRIKRLSEVIEESIIDMILNGQLKVGSKMPTELEMSKQFGVSVISVREALRGLEAFGIIRRKRGRGGGTYIADTKVDQVKNTMHYFLTSKRLSTMDLIQTRMIIEPAIVSLASKQMTSKEIKILENNVEYCKNLIKSKRNTLNATSLLSFQEGQLVFHRVLAQATRNPLLTLIVDYLMDFLSVNQKTTDIDNAYLSISLKYHEDILNNLKEGNVSLAEQNMLEHVRASAEYHMPPKKSHPKINRQSSRRTRKSS